MKIKDKKIKLYLELLVAGKNRIEMLEPLKYTGDSAENSLRNFIRHNSLPTTAEEAKEMLDSMNMAKTKKEVVAKIEAVPTATAVNFNIDVLMAEIDKRINTAVEAKIKEAIGQRTEAVEVFHIPNGVLSGKTEQRGIRIDPVAWRKLDKFCSKYPTVTKTDVISFFILEGIKKYSGIE